MVVTAVHSQTFEELHQSALKEGGTVNFYGTLAQITAAKILAVFEKRFPGMRVNQIDATLDKLTARVIAEARGGKVLADSFGPSLGTSCSCRAGFAAREIASPSSRLSGGI